MPPHLLHSHWHDLEFFSLHLFRAAKFLRNTSKVVNLTVAKHAAAFYGLSHILPSSSPRHRRKRNGEINFLSSLNLCIQLNSLFVCVYNISLQIYPKVLRMLVRRQEGRRESRERGRDRDRRGTMASSSMSSDWSERDLTPNTSSPLPPQMLSSPLPPVSPALTAPTLTTQDYPATLTLKLPSGFLNRMYTIRQTEGVRLTYRAADRL